MATIKVILILVVISNVVYVFSENRMRTVTEFPVAGLFRKFTSIDTQLVFEETFKGSDHSSTASYTGRAIVPSASEDDTYSIALEVCTNTSESDAAVVALIDFRPTNGICDTVCLLCNKMNIAHLTVGWEPIETMLVDNFTFAYYPPPKLVSKAYATLIRDLGWQKFTIFYEDDSSFVRLQHVIDSWPYTKFPITFRRLIPKGQNGETFKYIFKSANINHHIIDCEVGNILHYMKEIVEVENSTRYQSFILTNLDAHTIDLKSIPQMDANVSTMFITNNKMEADLTKDVLKHLRLSITSLKASLQDEIEDEELPALCFDESRRWSHSEEFRKALQETTAEGETGHIEFDKNGRRINFTLNYAKLDSKSEFKYAGNWSSTTEIIMTDDAVKDRAVTQSGVITVISRKGMPYFNITYREDGSLEPYGYVVDLVTEIFEKIEKYHDDLKFTLVFREVKDGEYGNPVDGTTKWNGIMGELMDHTADLGICDLTITSERNSVVDFSTPFMTTGISMLFKKEDPVDPDMFSFINPLEVDVWLYLATTYIIVSFIFLICARMSNLDWVNPHPCNQNPEKLENIWSFYNCTWFAMGTIMTQGCDILPRGLGSRWIAGMWWFFAMIVTASYTANMSTFLSNSRRSNDIENAQQLAQQNRVSYGAVLNASTYKFFKNATDPTYVKIWETMNSARPSVFTKSNEKGMERVLKSKDSNFAFFMESSMIKYYTERNCRLKMVGQPLDSKSYGIAMPRNFGHKADVDRAIIELQESGRLSFLENKWWKVKDKDCDKQEEEEDDGSLQMKNTSGIFLVLGVGGILGIIVAVIDFLINANRIAVKEKVTFKEALLSEWNASLNPRTLAKPAAPPRSAPPSSSSGSPSLQRERSTSRAVSVLRAATSFINFDEIY